MVEIPPHTHASLIKIFPVNLEWLLVKILYGQMPFLWPTIENHLLDVIHQLLRVEMSMPLYWLLTSAPEVIPRR